VGLRHVVFFLIATALWALGHWYVGRTLLDPLALEKARRRQAWILLAALALLAPITLGLGRGVDEASLLPLRWIGFGYMGLFTVVFFGSLFRDLLVMSGRIAFALRRLGSLDPQPPDPERRRFFANAANAGLLAGSGALSAHGVREALRAPALLERDVPIRDLPEALRGYRILQISDLHVGPTIRREFVQAVVEQANALAPDAVVVTGDLVDGTVHGLSQEVAPLAQLRARDGVFFVTGNHEYFWDADAWIDEVERLGMIALGNSHHVVRRGPSTLLFAGCHDHREARRLPGHGSDPAAAKAGAPACDLEILLAHQPQSYEGALEAGYDLQISGHTHGGQFFPITLLVGLAHPFVAGLHRVGSMWLYVSRGTGYWGPPLRTGARSEIAVLRLIAEEPPHA